MHELKLVSKINHPFISSNKTGLSLKLFLLRQGFKLLQNMAPSMAQRFALRIFLTPPRHKIPEWHKAFLNSAEQSTILVSNKQIKLYRWGEGPPILLIHGWGGRGTQLNTFIHPLNLAGFSVVAIDGPAHGSSSGKQTDMFEFAKAIHTVSSTINPHAIVAHSFGSACTLLALDTYLLNVSKIILIGCPSNAVWITEAFADKLAISKNIIAGMRKKLERRYDNTWTWEDLALTKLINKVNIPTLLIHDKKDREVPYQHMLELQKAYPAAQLFATEGQGHRRILRSAEVIDRVITFIKN